MEKQSVKTFLESLNSPNQDFQTSIKTHSQRYAQTLNILSKYLSNEENSTVLDLGTGQGCMALLTKHFFPKCSIIASDLQIGEDIDELLAKHGIETKDNVGLSEKPMPLGNSSFDVVLFLEVLEHVILEPTHIIKELQRISKPNGIIILTTPNIANLFNRIMLLFGKQPQLYLTGLHNKGNPRHHFREWTMNELTSILEGPFQILEAKYIQTINADGMIKRSITLRLLYPVYNFLCCIKPSFRNQIIIVAKNMKAER